MRLWNDGPIIVFLAIFLVLPLVLAIWIWIMRRGGRWSNQPTPSGFEVKLNTADTAKSTVIETRD